MHELSITQSMLEIIFEQARQNRTDKILHIDLVVGKMAGVVPSALRSCFEILTPGTIAQGAALHIEEPPFVGTCKKCGNSFEIIDYRCLCPECKSPDIETVGGQELYIEKMEVA